MGDSGDDESESDRSTQESGAFEFDLADDESEPDEPEGADGDEDEESDSAASDNPELNNPDDDGSTDGKEQASPNAMPGAADVTEDDDPTEDDEVGEDPLKKDDGDGGADSEFDAVDFSKDEDVDFDGSGSEQSRTAGQSPPSKEEATADAADSDDNGEFYDIDPVDESEKAFNFAEKQSKAAYEFAYEGATQNPLTELLRKYTSEEVRKRLDQVFSRKMLGSVLIGMSFTNIIVVSIDAATGRPGIFWWEPFLWVGIFALSVFIFVWWERLARTATEAANQAAESANQAAESASEAAESATKKAEAASEAASQAAESATGGDSTQSEDSMASPTKLDAGTEAGAGQRAGTHRAPARRRAPDRRPNKRFRDDKTRQQRLSTFENGDEFEQVELEELPQQGGGFENAGERDPTGTQASADDD